MAKNGELHERVAGCHYIRQASTMDYDLKKAIRDQHKFDVDDILKADTVKYYMDGSVANLDPYPDQYCDEESLPHGYREPLLWDEDVMRQSMEEAQAHGFSIHVHTFGDHAIQSTVNCMISAQTKANRPDARNTLAHCDFVAEEDKKRMAEYGIIASIQPKWQNPDYAVDTGMVRMYGVEKFKTTYPNKSLMDAGVICAYGSDFPVNPTGALEGIQTAITRRLTKIHQQYAQFGDHPADNPAECCSLKEAIQAHTIMGAYQYHWENITGSIELGKSAELVILDKDIEQQPVDDIVDLKIMETVFKGETTYKAE